MPAISLSEGGMRMSGQTDHVSNGRARLCDAVFCSRFDRGYGVTA
jgi:hypothetical protein